MIRTTQRATTVIAVTVSAVVLVALIVLASLALESQRELAELRRAHASTNQALGEIRTAVAAIDHAQTQRDIDHVRRVIEVIARVTADTNTTVKAIDQREHDRLASLDPQIAATIRQMETVASMEAAARELQARIRQLARAP